MGYVLSIAHRELLTWPRRKWFHFKRAAFVILGCVVILSGSGVVLMASYGRSGASTMGLHIFEQFSMSMLFVMCILPMITAAGLLVHEKEDRTLGLLFMTDVNCRQLILGKLVTALFSTVMTILSLLPLQMLIVSLGGVSTAQILAAFLVVLSTVFLSACVGLFIGAVAGNERTMGGLVGLLCLLIFVVLPCSWFCGPMNLMMGFISPEEAMCFISPFGAMNALIRGEHVFWGLLNCGMSLGGGTIALLFAWNVLPSRIISREKPPAAQRVREAVAAFRRVGRLVRRPRLRGDPLIWKDFHLSQHGYRGVYAKAFISTVAVAMLPVTIGMYVKMERNEILGVVFWAVVAFSCAIFALGLIHSCGRAFNMERRMRTLEPLLLTDLTDREIIWGKVRSAFLSVHPWLIVVAGAWVIMAVGCLIADMRGANNRVFWEATGYTLLITVPMCFGLASLSLYLSLRYKRDIAFGVTLMALVLWYVFGMGMTMAVLAAMINFGLMPPGPEPFMAVNILFFCGMGAFCLFRLIGRFREIAVMSGD